MSEKYGITMAPMGEGHYQVRMTGLEERQKQSRDLQFDYAKILNKH